MTVEWLASFFETLKPNTQIITANQRLCRFLLEEYALYQKKRQQFVYHPPVILPIHAWLEKAIFSMQAESKEAFTLLNDSQALILFENMIEESEQPHSVLLNAKTISKMALEAFQRSRLWKISSKTLALQADTLECKRFLKWEEKFIDYAKQHRVLEKTQAYTKLSAYYASEMTQNHPFGSASEKPTLILFGFDDLAPLFRDIFEHHPHFNCHRYQANSINEQAHHRRFEQLEEEIAAMAHYAKMMTKKMPHKKIACVFPTLHEIRPQVEKIFKQIFSSQNFDLVNISGGEPLSSFPMIHTALHFLKSLAHPHSIELWTTLLSCPFLGQAETEFFKRKKLLANLGNGHIVYLDLMQLNLLLKKQPDESFNLSFLIEQAAHFHHQTIQKLSHESSCRASLAYWTHYFVKQLQLIGWPGERTLNSEEYQTEQRFLSLLEELAHLAHFLPDCSFDSALKYFECLLNETLFQVQTRSETPIQVLGLLEASGHYFHHVWLGQCDEYTLPAAPKPNPFLPLYLQKNLNLPHASFERENQLATQLVKRLQENCIEFIISYHAVENDRLKNPSYLFNTYPEWAISDEIQQACFAWTPTQYYEHFSSENLLEDYQDFKAPPLIKEREGKRLHGGSTLLKWHADCPFQSFAKSRLKIKTIPPLSFGLSPQERGKLIHLILEKIWKKWPHSEMMHQKLSVQTADFKEALETIIKSSIQEIEKKGGTIFFHSAHKKLEVQLQTALILDWLKIECERPFFEVVQTEYASTFYFADFELKIRADRIDYLPSEHARLIVDYKTGKAKSSRGWFTTPLTEPQLPLYSLSVPNVIGISFAQVVKGDCHYRGLSETDLGIWPHHEKIDFRAQQKKWQQEIEMLLHDFLSGNAALHPREGEKTCSQCSLSSLCRKEDLRPTQKIL